MYVDDIICIIRHSDQEMILNEINLQYDNIKLLIRLNQIQKMNNKLYSFISR